MNLNFDIDWTLADAIMVTTKEYNELYDDLRSKKKREALFDKGSMFTDSLLTVNTYCRDKLIQYRESLVYRFPSETQQALLDELYDDYRENYTKTVFAKAISSFSNFLKFLLE